ncbi:hypothetical protein KGY73_03245 [bacterium]|nr:hypothetical protein [bacterium]
MKRIFIIALSFFFIWIGPLFSQTEKKTQQKEISPEKLKKTAYSYQSQGRRDPFRNLLAGKEVKETDKAQGIPQISIDEVVLIGIVKAKGRYTAIISSPQEFPYYIHEGDKFSNGFVLSIEKNKVIFRKTKERGIPLLKPKDIVKEISLEER